MFKRRKKLLLVLLCIALVAAVVYLYYLVQGLYYQSQLNATLVALDQREPGWRWEDRYSNRPTASKEESLAEELQVLMRLLTIDEFRASLGRNAWGIEFDRIDIQGILETERQYYLNHPEAQLEKSFVDTYMALYSLAPGPEAIDRLLNLQSKKTAIFDHRYRPLLMGTLLPNVQSVRSLATLLHWKAAVHTQAQQPEEAARHIHAILQLTRVFDQDAFWICYLIRASLIRQVGCATHRLLAQSPGMRPETLLALQQAFAQCEERGPSLPELLRRDRAILDHDLELMQKTSVAEQIKALHNTFAWNQRNITGVAWIDRLLLRLNPLLALEHWAYPRHIALERKETLEHFERLIHWAQQPEDSWLTQLSVMKKKDAGLPAFIVSYLEQGGISQKDYHERSYSQTKLLAKVQLNTCAECRTVIAALAIERFRLEKQRWPASLDELVPQYLTRVPLDPFTGKSLLYLKDAEGVTVYSVGVNGMDQQGTINPFDKQYENDIGCRLWNSEKRRQNHSKEITKAVLQTR